MKYEKIYRNKVERGWQEEIARKSRCEHKKSENNDKKKKCVCTVNAYIAFSQY